MEMTLLYFTGCPNWKIADEQVDGIDIFAAPGARVGLTFSENRS